VEEAADGEAALNAVARRLPRLVILDLRMPGIDGFQVLEWMHDNVVLRVPLVIGVIALDVAVIFGLLCAGSQRCPTGSDDCFRTFRGRRHGGPSLSRAFNNWLQHIEHVGKKHR
jgi:ActR/RegA family two-component response regulator